MNGLSNIQHRLQFVILRERGRWRSQRQSESKDLALFVLLAILITVINGFSQTPNRHAAAAIPKHQRVTLRFEDFAESSGMIRLRLVNGTIWTLRVPVDIKSRNVMIEANRHKDGAEAAVRYYLQEYDPSPEMQVITASGQKMPPDEPKHPPVREIHRIDVLTDWYIPPGQSVVFSVPKADLARNVELYVYLRYEWEDLGTETLEGPVHLVYFRGVDLPTEVQSKIR
jgi:hypothetical protein